MIGIEITTNLGVFMLVEAVPLSLNAFKLRIEDFENVIYLEAIDSQGETVYLPKHLLLHGVYKNLV